MKVVLLNPFFHPDLSATAQMLTDLAEDLAASGLEVTALVPAGVDPHAFEPTPQDVRRVTELLQEICQADPRVAADPTASL